jgi:hypothetical protein
MDVSKQLVSSGVAHMVGMLIAVLAQMHAGSAATSECSWYFVVFSVDTTLGVCLVLSFHELCVWLARRRAASALWQCAADVDMDVISDAAVDGGADDAAPIVERASGDDRCSSHRALRYHWVYDAIADCGGYGNPPDFYKWAAQVRLCCGCAFSAHSALADELSASRSCIARSARAYHSCIGPGHSALTVYCMQLAQFTVCVVLARILCGVVVIAASAHLAALAAALDGFFPGRPVALLLFVMVVCPMGMNTGQACVQDQFLKWRDRRGGRTVSSEPHHTLLAIDLEERHGYS